MPRADLPPGPSYPTALQGMGFWTRPLGFLERQRARYGRRFTIRLPFTPPFVILTDPADVKEVFTAPPDVLHPGEGARILGPLVGHNSVILLDEGAHMEQRKLMLPAFHGEKMERLTDLMGEVAEREVGSWPAGETVALHPRMQNLTLEIILRAVFGLDPGPRLDALREHLGGMLAFGNKPISLSPPTPGTLTEKVLSRFGTYADFLRVRAEADALIFELIDERRAAAVEGPERDDVLAMLIDARHEEESPQRCSPDQRSGCAPSGTPMSDQELRDELMTLLVAGHETTASTLAWALAQLPRNPAVLGRLTEEIDSGDGDAYLTATIQETLRRRPVLPNVAPRLVMRQVDVGGWSYPPGVCLVANGYLMHHDPLLYEDPYAFRPERFLDDAPGTYTWIPFGGGRRRCLGASFAMVEAKIVLRAVLSAREVRPASATPEVARRRNITIRPGDGARAVLGERRGEEVAA